MGLGASKPEPEQREVTPEPAQAAAERVRVPMGESFEVVLSPPQSPPPPCVLRATNRAEQGERSWAEVAAKLSAAEERRQSLLAGEKGKLAAEEARRKEKVAEVEKRKAAEAAEVAAKEAEKEAKAEAARASHIQEVVEKCVAAAGSPHRNRKEAAGPALQERIAEKLSEAERRRLAGLKEMGAKLASADQHAADVRNKAAANKENAAQAQHN